ncbi:MAG: hypothetical protein KGM96_15115 [Acidobacteriota bacterium]|nr:hypothetical protein [Acidobacteriota bacterium]
MKSTLLVCFLMLGGMACGQAGAGESSGAAAPEAHALTQAPCEPRSRLPIPPGSPVASVEMQPE